jgi:Flp pilus assembly protein TadG
VNWINRAHTQRTESGAAAVEFALVSVILIPLILGMIQYGLLFNDYLQVRQGVRLAARVGVVKTPITCSPATVYADQVACYTKAQVAPVSGRTAVKVLAPSGWTVGQPLTVCAVTESAARSAGIVPVPNSGFVRAITQMSIEQGPAPTGTFPAYSSDFSTSSNDPSGDSWSWCT